MQANDIPVRRANSRDDLQDIFDADFRGLVVSMIHKFETIRKDSSDRENIFVFIDEAHRSVAADLGSYLMAAVPNSTIIGFTGTPVGGTQGGGSGSFQIFGAQDEQGYLHKYSIIESIDDETTFADQVHACSLDDVHGARGTWTSSSTPSPMTRRH
jgi:type I restriction enzyme R subunit